MQHPGHGADLFAALFRGEDSFESDAGAVLMSHAIHKWLKTPTQKA
jgi:hypothetical protein